MALGLALSAGSAYSASHAGGADEVGQPGRGHRQKVAGWCRQDQRHEGDEADAAGGGASAACEKSAADKKLAGAAKTSHIECMEDAKPAAKAAEAPKK